MTREEIVEKINSSQGMVKELLVAIEQMRARVSYERGKIEVYDSMLKEIGGQEAPGDKNGEKTDSSNGGEAAA